MKGTGEKMKKLKMFEIKCLDKYSNIHVIFILLLTYVYPILFILTHNMTNYKEFFTNYFMIVGLMFISLKLLVELLYSKSEQYVLKYGYFENAFISYDVMQEVLKKEKENEKTLGNEKNSEKVSEKEEDF